MVPDFLTSLKGGRVRSKRCHGRLKSISLQCDKSSERRRQERAVDMQRKGPGGSERTSKKGVRLKGIQENEEGELP